jgi:hypothetical protein
MTSRTPARPTSSGSNSSNDGISHHSHSSGGVGGLGINDPPLDAITSKKLSQIGSLLHHLPHLIISSHYLISSHPSLLTSACLLFHYPFPCAYRTMVH